MDYRQERTIESLLEKTVGKTELKDKSRHLLSNRRKINVFKVMNTIAMGSNLLWWQDAGITWHRVKCVMLASVSSTVK